MMRNKAGSRTAMSSSASSASSSSGAAVASDDNNNNININRTGLYGESSGCLDRNDNPTSLNATSSQLPPLPKSAADMFKTYTNGLEFGNSNAPSSSFSNTAPTTPATTTTTTIATASNGHTTASSSSSVTTSSPSLPASSSSKPGTTKAEIADGAKRLAKELDDFIKTGLKNSPNNINMTPFPRLDNAQLSDKAVADLQLATARKLRELLPTNRDLLHVVQERNWIPLLLSWLNLHDRPAVQVEALLALTNMAELCAQQTYYQHAQQQQAAAAAAAVTATTTTTTTTTAGTATSNSVAAAAVAAAQVAAVAAMNASAQLQTQSSMLSTAVLSSTTAGSLVAMNNSGVAAVAATTATVMTPATVPYPSLVSPPQATSVPFPPLSFSQTLSPEAVAAFDASLTSTIQQQQQQLQLQQQQAMQDDAGRNKGRGKSLMPPSPLFPSPSLQMPFSSQPYPTPTSSGTNFAPLAPGQTTGAGGAAGGPYNSGTAAAPSTSSSSSSSAFLPPPTPVPEQNGKTTFPQQLSTSSQHLLLRHADAIPTLISLLASPNREVYEQALWILGSIAAGDSPASNGSGGSGGGSSSSTGGGTGGGSSSSSGGGNNSSLDASREKTVSARDVILAAGVMNHLPRCLERHPNSLSLQRIGSWTLSNLMEGIFQQQSHGKSGSNSGTGRSGDYTSSAEIHMETLLPILHRLLHIADAEVLSYTCWTLSHLCDGPSSHIAAVVTSKDPKAPRGGLVPRLVDLLLHPSWRVTKPALRTIGNIVCAECSDENTSSAAAAAAATADYTEVVLECGAVPRLKKLVTHHNREIQKEACWTLSNIAAGTIEQIQAVIDSGAIPPLVNLVSDKKTDQEVRSEACWVVLNATSCGSDSQIEVLVDEGCVSVLSVLLTEASMAMMALEGLERVLQVEEARELTRREQIENGEIEDDDDNRTPTLVSAGLIEKALEKQNSSAVTKRAGRIWKQHFVSCALCHKSFSKHRTTDATFCEECKCYVCCNCDCKVYHLSYQEELWAATEEKTEAKKNAKKSKNKKKKEKLKQKKSKQQDEPEPEVHAKPKRRGNPQSNNVLNKDGGSRSPTLSSLSDTSENKQRKEEDSAHVPDQDKSLEDVKSSSNKRQQHRSPSPPNTDDEAGKDEAADDDLMMEEEEEEEEDGIDEEDDDGKPTLVDEQQPHQEKQEQPQQQQQPDIDFVLYLQQTGSIIALAKLMDALEYGDNDEELDDPDLKLMVRQQQLLNRQQQQATI